MAASSLPFLGQCRKTFCETGGRPLREKIPMSGGHVRIIYQDRAHRRGPIRQFVLRRLLVLCPFTARRRWLWLFRGVAPRPTKAARASIWLRQTDRAERWHRREDGSISSEKEALCPSAEGHALSRSAILWEEATPASTASNA